jgi:hypothetical protein
MRIVCIVEGQGDRDAAPIVIRRIINEIDPTLMIEIPKPIRIPKNKLLKEGELERAVKLAGLNASSSGAILVVLDSDDHCPAETGPELLKRAIGICGNIPLSVILAKREFESWFLAAAESLRGVRGLPNNLHAPSNPEAIHGAKEWLADRMGLRKYVATLDQPAFASLFDLATARRADSFDKFYREVSGFLKKFRMEAS